MRPIAKGDTKSVANKITSTQVTARPVALLTLGLVGSGKTTFLNYISKVSAKEYFAYEGGKASAHWVYVDFRDFSLTQSPRERIVDAAFSYIGEHAFLRSHERCLIHAYAKEIENLRDGPLFHLRYDEARFDEAVGKLLYDDYQRKEPYCYKILAYASKRAPVFIVVDNVDQIEDVALQSKVFLEALSFARSITANLVLAMRDATYVKNRSSPIFDAFDFDAVYIDAPDIQAVLSRRFTIAEQLLRGRKIEFTTETGIKVRVEDARVIIEMLKAAILGTDVGRLIEVSATGDTRLALQMTRQFLQYGYSSSTRAVEVYQRTGKYNLPPHEALRGIMFGNQSIYRDSFSPIGNPFDAYLGKTDAQLLRLYIMSVLVNSASSREFEGMESSEIISNLQKIGFSERIGEKVLKDLIEKRFIHSRSHQDYSRESVVAPSRLAGYVVRELVGRLMFLETTMFDTFIASDAAWIRLKEIVRKIYAQHDLIAKLHLRKEAVQLFFSLIEENMERLVGEARRRGLPPVWCVNPMARVKGALSSDLTRALSSAQRIYGQPLEVN
jgi:hypothetical protein